jgi:hypothetical protein
VSGNNRQSGRKSVRGLPATTETTGMEKGTPIELNPSNTVEIDGGLVARGLGLALADFRQLMEHKEITVLCERGIGEDAGLYRASFYHQGKRLRLVIDGVGNPQTGSGTLSV